MDRSEEINQCLKNLSITPIDIKQEQLNVWHDNTSFDPSTLDYFALDKKISPDAVKECLTHNNNISNSNLVRNADWVGKGKVRIALQKFKISH